MTPEPAGPPGRTWLPEAAWRSRQRAHHARVDHALAPHRERAARGIKHPVEDFLFEYYSFRPYQLRRWHPGHQVVLIGGGEYLRIRDYHRVRPDGSADDAEGVAVDVDAVLSRRGATVAWAFRLLRATASRPASFGCFGMHEWAMVDGLAPEQTRHPQLGLRLAPRDITRVLDRVGLRCTHVDAVRFFTPAAAPRNAHHPTRATQAEFDDPGCLHVGMDLYKIAYKLSPLTPSDLLWQCFELARDIRELDMRASPYDVSSFGLSAVAVETPRGRAEYVRRQRGFAERATPLRRALLDVVAPLAARAGVAR